MISPYLTTAEAAIYLRFVRQDGSPDVQQVMQYVRRNGIKYSMRGRRVLVHKDDLEQSLEVPKAYAGSRLRFRPEDLDDALRGKRGQS